MHLFTRKRSSGKHKAASRDPADLEEDITDLADEQKEVLAGWAKCRDLLSGETFYLDRKSGDVSQQWPGSIHKVRLDSEDSRITLDDVLAKLANAQNEIQALLSQQELFAAARHTEARLADKSLGLLSDAKASVQAAIEHEEEILDTKDNRLQAVMAVAHPSTDLETEAAAIFRTHIYDRFLRKDRDPMEDERRYSLFESVWGFASSRVLLQGDDTADVAVVESGALPRYRAAFALLSAVNCVIPSLRVFLHSDSIIHCDRLGVTFNAKNSATELLRTVYETLQNRSFLVPEFTGDMHTFTLKARGRDEFFWGDLPLIEYAYVREALNRSQDIELVLVEADRYTSRPSSEDLGAQFQAEFSSKVELDRVRLSTGIHQQQPPSSEEQTQDKLFRVKIRSHCVDLTCLPESLKYVTELESPSATHRYTLIQVKSFLCYGAQLLHEAVVSTLAASLSTEQQWDEWMTFIPRAKNALRVGDLPRETRVVFVLVLTTAKGKQVPIAWNFAYLVDTLGRQRVGPLDLPLFRVDEKLYKNKTGLGIYDFALRMNCGQACPKHGYDPTFEMWRASVLRVEFDAKLAWTRPSALAEARTLVERLGTSVSQALPVDKMPEDMQASVRRAMVGSNLFPLDAVDRQTLWLARDELRGSHAVLPQFLQSVDWSMDAHRAEAYRMLKSWAPFKDTYRYLELLGPEFPDSIVRQFAVEKLRLVPDHGLRNLIPQLVQALKFEPHHDSALADFLLLRGARAPVVLGNSLFWALVFETHREMFSDRYALLLEAFLTLSGSAVADYMKQFNMVIRTQRVGEMVASLLRSGKAKMEVLQVYRQQLDKLNERMFKRFGSWSHPLKPSVKLTTLNVAKCQFMSSKMAPLWLVFHNADPLAPDVDLILKVGDDVRQDILTIQHLKIFEQLWWSKDLDLRMSPYECLATGITSRGRGVGLIEVVPESETTSKIHWDYGGRFGALNKETLNRFLEENNAGIYDEAVKNFVRSCAGYCVATFVLGIGDRHNGNIMLKKSGELFRKYSAPSAN